VSRGDGSFLVEGLLPVEDLKERFGLGPLPEEGEGYYRTLAGFMVYTLGHIPEPGETVTRDGYRFEVVDMDGKRVDKVLLVPPPATAAGGSAGEPREK
jgi:putative hemolysin